MQGKKVVFYLGLASLRASSPFGVLAGGPSQNEGKNRIIRILIIMKTITTIMMMIMIII